MPIPIRVRYRNAVYTQVVSAHELRFAALVTAREPRSEEQWRSYANDLISFYEAQLSDLSQFGALLAQMQDAKAAAAPVIEAEKRLVQTNSIADAPAFLKAIVEFYQRVYNNKENTKTISRAQKAFRNLLSRAKEHRKLKKKLGRGEDAPKETSPNKRMQRWFK
jgi:hypothetical protein